MFVLKLIKLEVEAIVAKGVQMFIQYIDIFKFKLNPPLVKIRLSVRSCILSYLLRAK